MEETTTLSVEEIKVTPVGQVDGHDFTCCNADPSDACYSYFDADPHNGRW